MTLNQQIAELVGWKIVPRKVSPLYHFPDDLVYDTYSPDGEMVKASETQAQAWAHVPDYERDLNAVVEVLPLEFDISIRSRIEGGYNATLFSDPLMSARQGKWQGAGDTRQEATAKALLEFLKWKSQKGSEG